MGPNQKPLQDGETLTPLERKEINDDGVGGRV
jgi:hypothetical protein